MWSDRWRCTWRLRPIGKRREPPPTGGGGGREAAEAAAKVAPSPAAAAITSASTKRKNFWSCGRALATPWRPSHGKLSAAVAREWPGAPPDLTAAAVEYGMLHMGGGKYRAKVMDLSGGRGEEEEEEESR